MIYHTIITVHDTQLPLMGVKRFKHIVGISQAVGNDLQKRNIKKYNILLNKLKKDIIELKRYSTYVMTISGSEMTKVSDGMLKYELTQTIRDLK